MKKRVSIRIFSNTKKTVISISFKNAFNIVYSVFSKKKKEKIISVTITITVVAK